MNENFLQSLEDKCHRMLNAVEPGTVVAIHRRVAKDECFVVLRGKVRVTIHNEVQHWLRKHQREDRLRINEGRLR